MGGGGGGALGLGAGGGAGGGGAATRRGLGGLMILLTALKKLPIFFSDFYPRKGVCDCPPKPPHFQKWNWVLPEQDH